MSYLAERSTHSTALSVDKLTFNDIRETYVHDLESNASQKFSKLKTHLPQDMEPGDVILDCGASSGLLTHYLKKECSEQRVYGLDLCMPLLELARVRNLGDSLLLADIFNMPLPKNSIKVIILSSVMHELFSYAVCPYSHETVAHTLQQLIKLLQPGGRIIIKDPAKPENPDEELLFKLETNDGLTFPDDDEGVFSVDPHILSTYSKFVRFSQEFVPAIIKYFMPTNIGQGFFSAPAWYLSEFLRHRNLSDTLEHWNSEMRELYGVFTVTELRKICDFLEVECRTIEDFFNPDNHSAITYNEVRIWDADGNEIFQELRLPTGLLAVLEKKSPGRLSQDTEHS